LCHQKQSLYLLHYISTEVLHRRGLNKGASGGLNTPMVHGKGHGAFDNLPMNVLHGKTYKVPLPCKVLLS
jgi:hypothetical protein